MKFSITDFFSKCDQIHSFLQIWSYLRNKSVMENLIFCAVLGVLGLGTLDVLELYKKYNPNFAVKVLPLFHLWMKDTEFVGDKKFERLLKYIKFFFVKFAD